MWDLSSQRRGDTKNRRSYPYPHCDTVAYVKLLSKNLGNHSIISRLNSVINTNFTAFSVGKGSLAFIKVYKTFQITVLRIPFLKMNDPLKAKVMSAEVLITNLLVQQNLHIAPFGP